MSETRHNRPRPATPLYLATLLLIVPAALLGQAPASTDDGDFASVAHKKDTVLLADYCVNEWTEAAKLLETAADARPRGDAAAVSERLAAAELFHYMGSLARAQYNLEAAARQAMAEERIFDTAEILLKAATVAKERGQLNEALAYARSAEWLATSPRLTPAESAHIRKGVALEPLQGRTRGT